MSTAKTAFPTTPTNAKVKGDMFTFTNQAERAEFGWGMAGRTGARHIGGRYVEGLPSDYAFAAAVAKRAELVLNHPKTDNGVHIMYGTYVNEAFAVGDKVKQIPSPAQVAKLLGGWIHADVAEAAFNPQTEQDLRRAQAAALTK